MYETSKKRGFYIALAAVIVCVFTVAVVYKNMQYTEEQQLASLEEQNHASVNSDNSGDQLLDKNTAVADNSANATRPSSLSQDDKKTGSSNKKKKGSSKEKKSTQEAEVTPEEPETVETMGSGNTFTGSFDEEAGLLWPVEGNILMKYSMENSIYFQTLAQYKCNPAIIIESSKGTSVHAAADCTITDISENEETGLTVTTALDESYNVTYGQLENLTVTVGDKLKEGDKIGEIAAPTKYYVVEGSNLYLQVTENDQTVDPLLLLR